MTKAILIRGSFITDIITNSSSVVYSYAYGANAFYKLVNELLQEIGVDKKAEDLYDVYVIADKLLDYPEELFEDDPDKFEEFFGVTSEEWDDMSWDEERKLIEKAISEKSPEELEKMSDEIPENYDGFAAETSYFIRTKDGRESALTNSVLSLFSHEASYDG